MSHNLPLYLDIKNPSIDEQGTFLGFRASNRDVTDRKHAEVALKESEEKYRSMMEAMYDPVYICSSDYRISYMNPAMVRRAGWEAAGEPCYKVINGLDEKCPFCVHDRIQQGEHFMQEIVSPRDNRSYHVSHSPIFHEDGSISKMTIYRDVTDRKKAEQELQESEKHFKSLLKSASGFVVYRMAYDEKSPYSLRISFVSPSVKEILGYDPEAWKVRHFYESIHPDDIDTVMEAFRNAYKTSRFEQVARFYNPLKKNWIWIHAIAVGVRDDKGNLTHVNGLLVDITEKQKALDDLQAHKKELETTAKNLEEINTALNVLLDKREQDEIYFQERIVENMEQLVLPYLKKIRRSNLDDSQRTLLDIIQSNLNEITAKFSHQLSSKHYGLTPAEIKVADLVRQGQTNKEIAEVLNISYKTVERHREKIRKKLGISHKKVNLQSFLLSFQ